MVTFEEEEAPKRGPSEHYGSIGSIPLPPSNYSPTNTHLKTYTAGEDGSRLQQAAQALGLAQQRNPRKQVRKVHGYDSNPVVLSRIWNTLLDTGTEAARMHAVEVHTNLGTNEEKVHEEGGDLKGNLAASILGVIKAMVGPAILYLPHAFSQAGYATALPILIISTTLFLYSSQCLLDSWQMEQKKALAVNYSEEIPLVDSSKAQESMIRLSYPELAYRALGRPGQAAVQTGIALMQSGVCLTYLIFVPQNLHTAWLYFTEQNIPPSFWLMLMVVVQIPLSWIRDIRKLTPTNILANLLILYGLGTCIGLSWTEATKTTDLWTHVQALHAFQPGWVLFIGTSVLLFEGSITLLVPLQQAIDSEQERVKFPLSYRYTIICIIIVEFTFGMFCWMTLGDSVRTVLTTSLPSGHWATSVQLAYSLAVLFTFPLQNFPALEIATSGLAQATLACTGIPLPRSVGSSLLICCLALVAVATMEHLDKVVSLMGAMLGCPIALCVPPLLHSKLCADEISSTRLCLNRCVSSLGFLAMIVASSTTLANWKS